MHGRADHVGRIDGLLRAALGTGKSAALIVYGDAGIGKTDLLDHVEQRHAGHARVLRLRLLQSEEHYVFAGLSDLARPLEPLLQRLPNAQHAALARAIALDPPPVQDPDKPPPDDRFTVGRAMLSLLAEAADQQPLLVLVDDTQWLDAPSRDALLFAGRRLENEGVVLVFATRRAAWLDKTEIPRHELRGLDREAADALFDAAEVHVAPEVRRRLVEATNGNPLAMLEALRILPPEQLLGTEPLSLPAADRSILDEAFAQQFSGLTDATRHALLLTATHDTGDTTEILAALERAELRRADLEPAERARLITVTSGRIEFRHPLLRSALLSAHDERARRAAHRLHAAVIGTGGRAAWHLAAASDGPDANAAERLEQEGEQALARTAYAAADHAFLTAASLSVDDAARLRRTLAAARARWLSGGTDHVDELLDGVRALAVEPTQRADLYTLQAAARLYARPGSEVYELLFPEAARVEAHDGTRAAAMFAVAGLACLPRGEFARAEDCARRSASAAGDMTAGVGIVAAVLTGILSAARGDIRAADQYIDPVLGLLLSVDPLSELAQILAALAQAFVWTDRWPTAERIVAHIVDAARGRGAPSALPFTLAVQAELELRRGRVLASFDAASESVQLANETGQALASAYSLVALARTEAILGLEQACRSHLTAARTLTLQTGAHLVRNYADSVDGLLDLSFGRAVRASDRLSECADEWQTFDPELSTFPQWAADLIEAHVRVRDFPTAREQLALLETQAAATHTAWAQAGAARCRGMLAEDGGEEAFADALKRFEGMAFEQARTQLCLGMRRRRENGRDPSTPLIAAREAFDAAGARPWADQARAELRVMGIDSPAPRNGALRSLTPQELRIAFRVEAGHTNLEIAERLFLSVKTVEFHLRNVYRKQEISAPHKRRKLTELVRGVPPDPGVDRP